MLPFVSFGLILYFFDVTLKAFGLELIDLVFLFLVQDKFKLDSLGFVQVDKLVFGLGIEPLLLFDLNNLEED
jgi:hypothetical protein